MSTVQQPDDHFEIAQEKGVNSGYRDKVLRLRLLQIFAATALKKNLNIDYMLPLYGGDTQDQYENDPGVFLAQYIDDIYVVDEQGKRKLVKLDAASALPVIPKNHTVETTYQYMRFSRANDANGNLVIRAHNLRGDFSAPERAQQTYMSNVLLENIAAAMHMAQEAKLAGIEKVNFGATADPLKRLALQVACRYVGLDCSSEPAVTMSELPQDTYFKTDLVKAMENARSRFSLLPSHQIILPEREKELPQEDEAPKVDNQELVDDLEAAISSQLSEKAEKDLTGAPINRSPPPTSAPQPNMN